MRVQRGTVHFIRPENLPIDQWAATLGVKALDANGYLDKGVRCADGKDIVLLPTTLYYVIEK